MLIKNEGGYMKGETKNQRFIRVVEKRVQTVLDSIGRLSQCSNPRMYEWKDEQLEIIWESIDKEIQKCKRKYERTQQEKFKFKLSGGYP